ncbi:BQ5605_C006g04326 [Microbotryum silenes-dioicae]|uniref:BQ5605_C006g04326 protein n=1 Tax=Microbotryum silenes-dioicae TaxID=796604 RepID=A0A2X0M6M7_9BASI|nr:BQ5605_C006g04326 [Microbotryum silenes-dioicae]
MQDTLDDPTDVAIRIDTSSDSTVLSIGTGTASAHPVYMSLGVNAGFLKRENHGGLVVIAFLPKVLKWKMFRIYKRRVLHRALEILWAPIRHLLSSRNLFQFADGHYRYIRVYFGPVSVDYPEACWLTSLVQGYVPCCVHEPLKLQEGPAAPRTSADAYEVRRAASQRRTITAQTKAAKEGGYHLGRTVWDCLVVNGHELMVADRLHQMIKGMVKDITIDDLFIETCAQITADAHPRRNKQKPDELIGRIELNMRLMPLHSQLRRFKDGFQHSNWTGKHTRDVLSAVTRAARSLQGLHCTVDVSTSLCRCVYHR